MKEHRIPFQDAFGIVGTSALLALIVIGLPPARLAEGRRNASAGVPKTSQQHLAAVDFTGNAYVTGSTTSTDFPGAGSSAIQSTFGGGADAFVAKINPAGNALVYSTYLGGSATDVGNGIAVDFTGNAYVTGGTTSTDFPGACSSAIQSTNGGGFFDAFVTKINPAGSALVYSTYLGGSGEDQGTGIAVDFTGNVYVTGYTRSTNFPGTSSSTIQSTFGGGYSDGFVAKINHAGNTLVYSTYLGGSGEDAGSGIAVDFRGTCI